MAENTDTPIDILVNPLRFFSLEGEPFNQEGAEVDCQKLLNDLTSPDDDKSIEKIHKRYKLISGYDNNLFIVPVNEVILKKLIWPLLSAKQAFCLGNYLGCIALCGTVAEMVTIFLFELGSFSVNGVKLDDRAQKKLFGNTFEKLGQERRIEILELYGIMKKELVDEANQIRGIRRMYLHILSKEFTSLEKDAEKAYKSASLLIGEMVTLKPGDAGKITIPSHLVNFLNKSNEDKSKNVSS